MAFWWAAWEESLCRERGRMRRGLRRLAGAMADLALRGREKAYVVSALPTRFAPLFITGLPRVGSTLVYQAFVRRFAAAYVRNAAAATPRAPALVTRLLSRALVIVPPDGYRNRYGDTAGWSGPSQGREIWGRWFPVNQTYVAAGGCSDPAMREMQGTVSRIEEAFLAPFVNKSQGHAVRILPLCEAFPRAVFVRVSRDVVDVAESLLVGRRECLGDERAWFSAKPSNYASLRGLEPIDQVVGQIRGLDADMARDFLQVGQDRVIDVDYTCFCQAPRDTLDRVARRYEHISGHALRISNDVPDEFKPASRRVLAPSESLLLRRRLDELPADPSPMPQANSRRRP